MVEYHRPIITNGCPPKRFQKSLHPKLVAILPGVSEVGYNSKKIYIQACITTNDRLFEALRRNIFLKT